MANKKTGLTVNSSGSRGKNLEAKLKALRRVDTVKGYKVGWPTSAKYPDGAPVANVALWQEFGVPENNLPERPFFRNANRQFSRIAGRLILKLSRDGVINRKSTLELSQVHVRLVQSSILFLKNPPLAATTVLARKDSSDNPLVDTGLLRRTVTSGLIG